MKIQLETGSPSSATHSLTSPSHTLDRRTVNRPTNLAIEEAAARAKRAGASPSVDTPSRLVNLRMHNADLIAMNSRPVTKALAPSSAPKAIEPTPSPKTITSPSATKAIEPAPVVKIITPAPQAKILTPVPTAKVIEPVPEPKALEPIAEPKALEPTASDRALAISIAADYTAASLDATMADLPVRIEQRDKLAAAIYEAQNTPIDAIAHTASEAIAAIRTATDPEDVAAQISALKKFATNIQNNSDLPEMSELANTINKFIAIAEKSTGVKIAKQAAKTTKLIAKAQKPVAKPATISVSKPAASSAKAAARTAKSATITSAAQATSPAKATPRAAQATSPAKPATHKISLKPLRSAKSAKTAKTPPRSQALSSDEALEKALRSVASMEKTERPAPAQKAKTSKKGRIGRFMLALGCATACVAAIIYVVGTNIPDISVRVAALQTGVEAAYPSYIPRDFSLKGINSENGKITLTFVGPDNASFTLIEEKSSWDSAALERNYVKPTWDDTYTTTHEQGITIYMYGTNAAWVNGGVLYKINSDSNSLTKKQLRNIVLSMQ